jgi:hypothetical protein
MVIACAPHSEEEDVMVALLVAAVAAATIDPFVLLIGAACGLIARRWRSALISAAIAGIALMLGAMALAQEEAASRLTILLLARLPFSCVVDAAIFAGLARGFRALFLPAQS